MFNFTKAYSERGADMGRCNIIVNPYQPIKMKLERVRLDSGGYDKGGAYWGYGNEPLYVAYGVSDAGEDCEQRMFVRAKSRDLAKVQVRRLFPEVRFWR